MSRPDFISAEDIQRWDENISTDPILLALPPSLMSSSVLREVCYAGLWLAESLDKLQCPNEIIVQLQFHAGKLSFGREPWAISQQILSDYINNKLIFESDSNESIN